VHARSLSLSLSLWTVCNSKDPAARQATDAQPTGAQPVAYPARALGTVRARYWAMRLAVLALKALVARRVRVRVRVCVRCLVSGRGCPAVATH
jgi:hypothetical protein